MIAEAINEKLSGMPEHKVSLFPVENSPEPEEYDLIYLGFWADKGGADTKTKEYMGKIRNKTVALFFTAGVYAESEHAAHIFNNAKNVLDKSNTVPCHFRCMGKIDPKILERSAKAHGGMTPERAARIEEAKKHPNETDCANAAAFALETADKLKVKKALVVYSSLTGNTKMIAEHIHKAVPRSDIFDIDSAPAPDNYDLIFTGFWVHGAADPKSLKFFEKIRGKLVAPFFTLGAYPDSESADRAFEDTQKRLENNIILGHFRCHGKIAPEVLEKMKQHHGSNISPERAARHKEAEKHPDENDCLNAEKFAADILKKVSYVS
jgi:flavodoxin